MKNLRRDLDNEKSPYVYHVRKSAKINIVYLNAVFMYVNLLLKTNEMQLDLQSEG